ncbi:DUF1249 domain-containing protein [Cognatilysobacter bugurensis]|nr:DUF1249 domain-containing protein [Lysobacter bugurensis]
MTSTVARHALVPKLDRLGWLMALYTENEARLVRMFAPRSLAVGHYRSDTGDGLPLHLEIIEQHPYTTELRITYAIVDPVTGEPDPSAHLRLYHDTRQLEATNCYVGRRWQDVIGMFPPPALLIGHRLRMNTFLGKWLEYLAERGHGAATLRRLDENSSTLCETA